MRRRDCGAPRRVAERLGRADRGGDCKFFFFLSSPWLRGSRRGFPALLCFTKSSGVFTSFLAPRFEPGTFVQGLERQLPWLQITQYPPSTSSPSSVGRAPCLGRLCFGWHNEHHIPLTHTRHHSQRSEYDTDHPRSRRQARKKEPKPWRRWPRPLSASGCWTSLTTPCLPSPTATWAPPPRRPAKATRLQRRRRKPFGTT